MRSAISVERLRLLRPILRPGIDISGPHVGGVSHFAAESGIAS
jgi:hypothetical protein